MAFNNGRQVTVYNGDASTGTVVAGVRTKTLTINNEPVDVTTDDADGFRTLLENPATRSVDLSVEGLLFDDTLMARAAGSTGTFLSDHTLVIEGIGEIAGNFFVNSYETGAQYEDAITFTVSLQSSGSFSYSPA